MSLKGRGEVEVALTRADIMNARTNDTPRVSVPRPRNMIEQFVDAAEDEFGFDRGGLRVLDKTRDRAPYRSAVAQVLHDRTGLSWDRVGRVLGLGHAFSAAARARSNHPGVVGSVETFACNSGLLNAGYSEQRGRS